MISLWQNIVNLWFLICLKRLIILFLCFWRKILDFDIRLPLEKDQGIEHRKSCFRWYIRWPSYLVNVIRYHRLVFFSSFLLGCAPFSGFWCSWSFVFVWFRDRQFQSKPFSGLFAVDFRLKTVNKTFELFNKGIFPLFPFSALIINFFDLIFEFAYLYVCFLKQRVILLLQSQ